MPTRRERANAIRALAMDAVERANSGHPGAPMGMADIAEVLWRDYLSHDPGAPDWADRDRFVLSNGHGSMLLYSLLHLTGYKVSLEDLKNFRQLHAPTAGHPEYRELPGVETTTGPLGQGFANAVGMALAEKILGARFNRPGFKVVDHHTWVFLGDGCLMEGVSHEVASLAGTHKLGKLICFYDDNGISIDGKIDGWFTDDTPGRFEAYGWQVIRDIDGHDGEAIREAIAKARADGRPSMLCCKTEIGFGSPNKSGTAAAHGAPLGSDEIALARKQLDWPHGPFEIPDDIRSEWDGRRQGGQRRAEWLGKFDGYRQAHPELAAEFERSFAAKLPAGLDESLLEFAVTSQRDRVAIASRQASKAVLDLIGPQLPELLGGSADLTGSNGTRWNAATTVTPDAPDAQYMFWGVREFGMTAACNGIALHGGLIPFGGTFLTFLDYARNAVRLAALMGVQNILVYTHDSLALGEDGPTHQPVEQLGSLRMTPNLHTWRPCDQVETAFAWQAALGRTQAPTALILSRQKLACPERSAEQLAAVARGGYVLVDPVGNPDRVIIATGSEVGIAVDAARELNAAGGAVRVVSMPCLEAFLAQDAAYRDAVLPSSVPRLVVEAGHPACWWRLAGHNGNVLGVERFGLSGPGDDVMAEYGFTAANVAELTRQLA